MDELDAGTTGQVTSSAAATYEAFFVPALFAQWPAPMLDTAELAAGDDVLDVGCGTGVLACAAARRLGESGSVTGIDPNEGMLTVAAQKPEPVTWKHGFAERLPFPDGSFHRVLSQFALMFFTDPGLGIAEMARVARHGGTVTIATWAAIDQSPGYAAMFSLLQRLFGDEVAAPLLAPFTIGTEGQLEAMVCETLPDTRVARHEGIARFESIEAWVHTDVRGWTLAEVIDDDHYDELLAAARTDLTSFVDNRGHVRFPAPALLATSTTPTKAATLKS